MTDNNHQMTSKVEQYISEGYKMRYEYVEQKDGTKSEIDCMPDVDPNWDPTQNQPQQQSH